MVRWSGYRKQRGATSLVFISMLPMLVSILAFSVSTGMYMLTVTRAGQASDAASLACGYAQRGEPTVMEGFMEYYRPGFAYQSYDINTIKGTKRCNISASYGFDNLMASALPNNTGNRITLTSDTESTARIILNSKPRDVSLVLDISGSMSGRLPLLKRIINNTIQDIQKQSTDLVSKVRIAVVPFESGVGVRDAPWLPASKGRVTCVDGMSPQGVAQTVDDLGALPGMLKIRTTGSCSSPILPLTKDLNAVRRHVDGLTASGTTLSYQGLIWGARSLINQWQQAWQITPVASSDLEQHLILFTDGNDDNNYFDELVKAGLCQVIQNEFNIQMSFIGFEVNNNRIRQFEDCIGNGNGKVYDAQNSADLKKFFKEALHTTTATLILE
ncbi:MAG: VWA domain-containing protein [Moritella sp.]|nr:VWA domain-containing protein [Moritella sp.]